MQVKKKLRILINSNAIFTSSGYAVQNRLLSERLLKDGYALAHCNFYGQEGGFFELNDIVMYPKMRSQWGEDAVIDHAKHFKADVTFTLQDIWTMNEQFLQKITRWIPILPVDHEPIPPIVKQKAKHAYRIVSYSQFGYEELLRNGMTSTYIPHVVDTNVFRPLDKQAVRKTFGIPQNIFLFGMIAANKDNPPRKSFQQSIDAFADFNKKYPNSGMFFHTSVQNERGFQIQEYWRVKNLPPDKIFYLEPYKQIYLVGMKKMVQLYNTFDCLVLPSTNEGFGVPIIEAQACGIPVITNNFTAMRHLIIPKKTGYFCDIAYKRFSPMGSFIAIPSVDSIYNNMLNVYQTDRNEMGKHCRKFMKENYDADLIYKTKWQPFLQMLENEIYNN